MHLDVICFECFELLKQPHVIGRSYHFVGCLGSLSRGRFLSSFGSSKFVPDGVVHQLNQLKKPMFLSLWLPFLLHVAYMMAKILNMGTSEGF